MNTVGMVYIYDSSCQENVLEYLQKNTRNGKISHGAFGTLVLFVSFGTYGHAGS